MIDVLGMFGVGIGVMVCGYDGGLWVGVVVVGYCFYFYGVDGVVGVDVVYCVWGVVFVFGIFVG